MQKIKWRDAHSLPISKERIEDVEIKDADGNIIFHAEDVVVPTNFSPKAATIFANQYCRNIPEGEQKSFFYVVDRIIGQIKEWAKSDNIFETTEDLDHWGEDLKRMLCMQFGAFNSPVWYNIGVSGARQQAAACFIGDVEDNMESITDRMKLEARVFKGGSGFGANNSKLRASCEPLSGGGKSSGPVSFMLIYDAGAEVIKSAGHRRAAKAELLDVDHPDIEEFITCKSEQEAIGKKLKKVLGTNTINQTGIRYQNSNLSVVVSDEFMEAVIQDRDWDLIGRLNDESGKVRIIDGKPGKVIRRVRARYLFELICQEAWKCGDPGLFYIDTVNASNITPEWGRIVAPNPCFEFLCPPYSACNLASLRIDQFFYVDSNGEWVFDDSEFKYVVRAFIIAMDVIARHSDYPDERIEENSKRYRPLGLGITNLGAQFIRMGLPYGSPKSLAIAQSIVAYMTAQAWYVSAEIMEATGENPAFSTSKLQEILEKVPERLTRSGIKGLDPEKIVSRFKQANAYIGLYGASNSQVTLLAPTGTISFLMDAETTGIEPLVSLGVEKNLSNGGVLDMSLPVCVHDYLGAKELDEVKGDPVLKTALGDSGFGTISYDDHLKIMAAVQPFLSGGISKTVNLPNSITSKDIGEIYIRAWKMGLKSISIYRDGSKFEQPLMKKEEEKKVTRSNGRTRLPYERKSITHKFTIGDSSGYVTVGLYHNGDPGEVFIVMSKQGSTVRGLLDSVAILISMCLQYGVPLERLIDKFKGVKFEPQGITSNENIMFAQSPLDYLARYLEQRFISRPVVVEETTELGSDAGEVCELCGAILRWRGNCLYCDNCNITSGCS